jgi:hypothetical protein
MYDSGVYMSQVSVLMVSVLATVAQAGCPLSAAKRKLMGSIIKAEVDKGAMPPNHPPLEASTTPSTSRKLLQVCGWDHPIASTFACCFVWFD